jgi:cation diffusion facilitator family transporter
MENGHAPQTFEPPNHVFLGAGHEENERRTWIVIALCTAMMAAEIIGGSFFGSLALIADGLHMSTHAGALLLAALAYTFARRHAADPGFSFGTGKVGDLAGYTSAIILGAIALAIGYEAVTRFLHPVPIAFREALPIAVLGLAVNVVTAWLLSGGHSHTHGHGHRHGHAHGSEDEHHEREHHGHDHHAAHSHGEVRLIHTDRGVVEIDIFEEGVPPRFRLRPAPGCRLKATDISIETIRPDGGHQAFAFAQQDGCFESIDTIPEPHAFTARLRLSGEAGTQDHDIEFTEPEPAPTPNAAAHRDNNMRAALIHIIADAAVSVLVILGLSLAWAFHWLWMDPLVGVAGAVVIANWAYGLMRDTGGILLDRTPDTGTANALRAAIEADGDRVNDLHLWRLGPGHLGVIVSVITRRDRRADYYRQVLRRFPSLSHLTIEVLSEET